jgi:hypothetical protein
MLPPVPPDEITASAIGTAEPPIGTSAAGANASSDRAGAATATKAAAARTSVRVQ